MKAVGLIVVVFLCKIFQNIYSKRASNYVGGKTQIVTYTAYQYLLCMLLAVILLPTSHNGFTSPATYGISFVAGIALFCGTICSLMALKDGTMLLCTLFGAAGFVVPSVAGIFLWHEILSIQQHFGIVLLIVAAYLLIGCSRQVYRGFSMKSLMYLIGIFMSEGIVMLSQKLYSSYVTEGSVSVFSFLAFGTAFVLLGAMSIFGIRKTRSSLAEVMSKQLWICGAVLAVMLFLINYMATSGSVLVPAVIWFSLMNGGSLIISALVAAIVYKEPISKKSILGMVLCMVALIIINTF